MKKLFATVFILMFHVSLAETWTQKATLTGGVRDMAVGFSIGAKGYIGTGYNSGAFTRYEDFWEWDPSTDVWTQKADFGGGLRYGAVGFSIGNKGYIGTGSAPSKKKDFWEYDPATNMWTQKADFGGIARWMATGFSIGTKGYIGLGTIGADAQNSVLDFWEWDGDSLSVNYNTWIQRDSFPGVPRSTAVGFSIGSKGYVGTGSDVFYRYKDFWEWDQATDTWIQKADFGGTARHSATGFSLGTNGYIGTGTDGAIKKDFWQWDGDTTSVNYNTWIQKTDFGGPHRRHATGFSIGNRGYIGMGFYFTVSTDDFWEYCDTCTGTGTEELSAENISVYPNPAAEFVVISSEFVVKTIEVYNVLGEKILAAPLRTEPTHLGGNSELRTVLDVSAFQKGIYFLKLSAKKDSHVVKVIVE